MSKDETTNKQTSLQSTQCHTLTPKQERIKPSQTPAHAAREANAAEEPCDVGLNVKFLYRAGSSDVEADAEIKCSVLLSSQQEKVPVDRFSPIRPPCGPSHEEAKFAYNNSTGHSDKASSHEESRADTPTLPTQIEVVTPTERIRQQRVQLIRARMLRKEKVRPTCIATNLAQLSFDARAIDAARRPIKLNPHKARIVRDESKCGSIHAEMYY